MNDHPAPPAPAFAIYAWGACYASVCTNLSNDAATLHLNMQLPTGIASQWQVAQECFRSGEPNGFPCPQHEGRRHLLFAC